MKGLGLSLGLYLSLFNSSEYIFNVCLACALSQQVTNDTRMHIDVVSIIKENLYQLVFIFMLRYKVFIKMEKAKFLNFHKGLGG
jgi:hypothetical protein